MAEQSKKGISSQLSFVQGQKVKKVKRAVLPTSASASGDQQRKDAVSAVSVVRTACVSFGPFSTSVLIRMNISPMLQVGGSLCSGRLLS